MRRGRERKTEGDRDRDTDRQTDRQTETETATETERSYRSHKLPSRDVWKTPSSVLILNVCTYEILHTVSQLQNLF